MSLGRAISAVAATRAGRIARSGFNAVVGDGPHVVRVRTGIARGALLELDLRSEKAYWLGHYEADVQRELERALDGGGVFYDIGAHIGFFSIGAANLGAEVHALEVSPRNAARIRRNAELNAFTITVTESAAWDSDAGVLMLEGDSSSEWRVAPGGGTSSTTIDEFARERAAPSVIKLDVEGSEERALRGAVGVLSEYRPVVICEFHHGLTSEVLAELLPAYRCRSVGPGSTIAATPR